MNTIYSNLKIKSKKNCRIAKEAERQQCYDAAVSRYYYCVLQLLNYILYNKEKHFKPDLQGGSSHSYTIDLIKDFVIRKSKNASYITEQDAADIWLLNDLKRWRVTADYKDDITNYGKFSNDFIKKFNICYAVCTKIIQKEGL